MTRTAAVELFLHARAEAARGAVWPAAEADPLVLELCEQLDDWPPAVELAGRRAAVQTVGELLESLQLRTLETVLDPAGDAHTGTIASAVTAALAELAGTQRALLAAVAQLRDWWTLDEVRDLAPSGSGSITDLSALIGREIVDRREDGDVTLFRVRRAFRERLGSHLTPDAIASLSRAAGETVDGMLTTITHGGGEADWYSVVGRRRRDLEGAADASVVSNPVAAAQIVLALCIYAAEFGDLARISVLLDRCVAAIAGSDEHRSLATMLRGYQLHRRAETIDPTADMAQLAADFDAAVADAAALHDPRVTLAVMAHSVRSARTIGHVHQADRHASEALLLAESNGMPAAAATFELLGAMTAHNQQRFADAADLAVRSLTHARRLGLEVTAALASLMFRQLPAGTPHLPSVLPSPDDVLEMVAGSVAGRSSLGVAYGVAVESFLAGNLVTAARAAATGVRTADRIGLPAGVGSGVMIAIVLASTSGEPEVAAQLHGGITDQLDVLLNGASPGYRALFQHCVASARSSLGDERFETEVSRGAALTLGGLTERAVRFLDRLAAPPHAANPELAALSPREIEVLKLLAAGTPNKRIAAELGISPKTAMHHTSSIYRKLGVRGRVEATAWAHRYGLAT